MQYRGDTELGKLMHDFSCSEPDEMYIPLMRKTASFYKKDERGILYMCEIFEEIRREGERRGERKGERRGERRGVEKGRKQYEALIEHLSREGRLNELAKVVNNKAYATKLFKEYHLM